MNFVSQRRKIAIVTFVLMIATNSAHQPSRARRPCYHKTQLSSQLFILRVCGTIGGMWQVQSPSGLYIEL